MGVPSSCGTRASCSTPRTGIMRCITVAAAVISHQQSNGTAQRAPLFRKKGVARGAVGDRGEDAARVVLLLRERSRAASQDSGRGR